VVEFVFESNELDEAQMVVDFGQVSDIFKQWIDKMFDHALLISDAHPREYLDTLMKYNKKVRINSWEPTAENLARYIYQFISDRKLHKPGHLIPEGIRVHSVRVHETLTGWAEYMEVNDVTG